MSLVTWFGLQDRGGSGPYQSGLFRHSSLLENAKAKPVRTAFRFPFGRLPSIQLGDGATGTDALAGGAAGSDIAIGAGLSARFI